MIFAIGTTLAGPRAAGRWAVAQNVAGQMAGIVAIVIAEKKRSARLRFSD
jgi:hypothetical protein